MTHHMLHRWVIALILLFPTKVWAADHAVLFIGNSYTSSNAPDSLEQSYMKLVQEGMPQYQDVSVARYAPGGYTLAQHLQDATSGSQLDQYLHDEDPEHQWDYVVVHEQSQIPGFPQSEPQWQTSRDAAVSLSEIISEKGAETRLMMTWGRRDGDSGNVWLYPDYPTMQAHLANGYQAYTGAIETAGQKVALIPVGLGWQQVYEEPGGEFDSEDPNLFQRLYSADGSHPSPHGTYLAACIVYGAITQQSPVGLQWAHDSIGAEDRLTLQKVSEALLGLGEDGGSDPDAGDVSETQDAGSESVDLQDAGLADGGVEDTAANRPHDTKTDSESNVGPEAQDIDPLNPSATVEDGASEIAEISQSELVSESPGNGVDGASDISSTDEQASSSKGGCAFSPRPFFWSFLVWLWIACAGYCRRRAPQRRLA